MSCEFWKRAFQNGFEWFHKVGEECYQKFPYDVRATLASWLESKETWIIEELNPDDPAHERTIIMFQIEVAEKYEKIVIQSILVDPTKSPEFGLTFDMRQERCRILNTLVSNVDNINIFRHLKDALKKEKELIQQTTTKTTRNPMKGEKLGVDHAGEGTP